MRPVQFRSQHGTCRHRAAGDVLDAVIGIPHPGVDRLEVLIEALLSRLVVVGRDHEQRVGSGVLGVACEIDGLGGGVGAGAGDDGDAALGLRDRDLDDALVLVVGEGGALAGGAHGHEAGGTALDQPIDMRTQGRLVHRAVLERRDHGGNRAAQTGEDGMGGHGTAPKRSGYRAHAVGAGRRVFIACATSVRKRAARLARASAGALVAALLAGAGPASPPARAEAPLPPLHPERVETAEATVAQAEVETEADTTEVAAEPDAQAQARRLALTEMLAAYDDGRLLEGDTLAAAWETLVGGDPAALLAGEWLAIRSGAVRDFTRLAAFLGGDPGWPETRVARRRAEAALFDETVSPATVIGFFARAKPTTAEGAIALARAFRADGAEADAIALARETWRDMRLSAAEEAALEREFGSVLQPLDHRVRFERMLFREDWRGAERLLGAFPTEARADLRSLVDTRRAVVGRARDAERRLDALPARLQAEPTVLYSRLKLLRHAERYDEAARLLSGAPSDPLIVVDGDAWWNERRHRVAPDRPSRPADRRLAPHAPIAAEPMPCAIARPRSSAAELGPGLDRPCAFLERRGASPLRQFFRPRRERGRAAAQSITARVRRDWTRAAAAAGQGRRRGGAPSHDAPLGAPSPISPYYAA